MATCAEDHEKPPSTPADSAGAASCLLDDIARMGRWARDEGVADQLKALHNPAALRSVTAAILDWLMIFGAFGTVVIWGAIATPLALILIGNRQRALGNLLHDASHGSFAGNRQYGDTLAGILLFLPLFAMKALYRREHFAHHRRLGSPGHDGDLIYCEDDMVCSWPGLLWRHMANPRIWAGSILGHLLRADAAARAAMLVWWGVVLLAIAIILRPADGLLFAALWLGARATTFHLMRHHIARQSFGERLAQGLRRGRARLRRRGEEPDEAGRRSQHQRPAEGDRRDGSADLPQMAVDIAKLHPIAAHLDLLVTTAEMVKPSRTVPKGPVSGQIPSPTVQGREARRRQLRLVEITQRRLRAAQPQLAGLPIRKAVARGVEDRRLCAGIRPPDRQAPPLRRHHGRLGERLMDAFDRRLGRTVDVLDATSGCRALPGGRRLQGQRVTAEDRQAQLRQAAVTRSRSSGQLSPSGT
jgi:hypothetical protein